MIRSAGTLHNQKLGGGLAFSWAELLKQPADNAGNCQIAVLGHQTFYLQCRGRPDAEFFDQRLLNAGVEIFINLDCLSFGEQAEKPGLALLLTLQSRPQYLQAAPALKLLWLPASSPVPAALGAGSALHAVLAARHLGGSRIINCC